MDCGQKMSKGISRYSFWNSTYYDEWRHFWCLLLSPLKRAICWLPAQVFVIILYHRSLDYLRRYSNSTKWSPRGAFFLARNLRCPQAARALHLVCQNDKVESSMCAEKILRSGEKYRCPQAARAVRLVCQNDTVESSRSIFKARDLRCSRTSSRYPSSLSKWQSGALEEHF